LEKKADKPVGFSEIFVCKEEKNVLFAAFSNSEPEVKLMRIIRRKEKNVFCSLISASYNNLILKASARISETGRSLL
jgi:hypothetical protein